MRLGVISDVHANLVALERVLEAMPPVDRLVCAGDVVGYNPWPAECVDRVREACEATVRGNHDRNVDTPERYRANHMAHAGLELADRRLDGDRREWVLSLPRKVDLADGRILMVHDHPEHVDQYVRPHQFPAIRPYLDDYDACILGHTHVQHEATVDGRLVLNPGSVGQPRDGDPRAAFAVVDTGTMTADLHRVEYDVDRVQAAIRETGLPERTAARLERGE
ncbi:metallophosphoesterase family protein [Salinirubellus sp. GCM10025818]|uniref:metallophosphoesterase family protein n=1 Tax=Salinirubellus TaxID=2162630 RepID=UPI0030D3AADD